jgi:hypothetical protein
VQCALIAYDKPYHWLFHCHVRWPDDKSTLWGENDYEARIIAKHTWRSLDFLNANFIGNYYSEQFVADLLSRELPVNYFLPYLIFEDFISNACLTRFLCPS